MPAAAATRARTLVARFSFGLADQRGRFAAQTHMASCDRCATLYRNLELAHQKIAALTPVPAVIEQTLACSSG